MTNETSKFSAEEIAESIRGVSYLAERNRGVRDLISIISQLQSQNAELVAERRTQREN